MVSRRYLDIRLIIPLMGLLSVACIARRPFMPPPMTPTNTVATVDGAKELLIQRYGSTGTLKTSGEMEVELQEGEKRAASFVLMLERPNRLRMRAYRSFGPTLFEFIADSDECRLYVPSEKVLYLSSARQAPEHYEDGAMIYADKIIAALFVVADPDELWNSRAEIKHGAGSVELQLEEGNGIQRTIWLDSQTGRATRQRFVNAEGATQAEIFYMKEALEGNSVVPVAVEIAFPTKGLSILLRMSDLRVEAKIPEGAFDFSPPQGVRILTLGDIFDDWFRQE